MKTATMFANGIKYNTKTEKAHTVALSQFECGRTTKLGSGTPHQPLFFATHFPVVAFYDK
jgi:hypothetical protein